MNKAVFLDRDGVINKSIIKNGKPYPPLTLNEVSLYPGVREAMNALNKNGWLLIVVSNQPDVARGTVKKSLVEEINKYLAQLLPIDDFFVCFHDDIDNCSCRKPLPGLILEAASKYNIDLESSFMIGDRWKDIDAGIEAGCKTIFLDYHYHERKPLKMDYTVSNLQNAVLDIINGST